MGPLISHMSLSVRLHVTTPKFPNELFAMKSVKGKLYYNLVHSIHLDDCNGNFTRRPKRTSAPILLNIYLSGKCFQELAAINETQFMNYRIWSFHGGDYEECRLLRCGAV
jgi:hypothetical protein